MRISTSQIFTGNVNNLSRANAELFKTQQQISTGKKILQPSDDPLASAQIIKLKQEIARNDQFQSNIELTDRRLRLQEITLNQLFTEGIRLKELTIQAGSAALTESDQAALATEVDEIIKQMFGLMNTQDVQGEYLFSGFKGNTRAYEFDQLTEKYTFQGDGGQRFIQIGADNRIAATDSGLALFEQVPGVVMPSLQDNDSVIEAVFVKDFQQFKQIGSPLTNTNTPAFNLSFETDGAGITRLNVTDAQGNFVFNNEQPPQLLNGLEVESGQRVTFGGVEIVVANTPAAGNTSTVAVNAQVERNSILNIALELRNGLTNVESGTANGKASLDELLAKTLAALEGVQNTNIRARGSLGARMNALEQQQRVNEDYDLFTKKALSSFEDLDYNEAISRFTLQQTALEAAYSSFNRISGLSLFNFIQ